MDCRTQLASMAIEELDKGDFLMATKILTTSIRLEPNNHELYYERSICHYKLGDFQASLDDANAAINLNSSDYNIYYQKGLALAGLSLFSDAVTTFKKSIELRAKQEDSKLSEIYKLICDATKEIATARYRKPGTTPATTDQTRDESTNSAAPVASTSGIAQTGKPTNRLNINNELVDSTTDKPILPREGQIGVAERNHHNHQINTMIKDNSVGNNGLVVTSNRNNQSACANQISSNPLATSRVSSSASQQQQQQQQQQQPVVSIDKNNHRLFSHTSTNGMQQSPAIRETKTPDIHNQNHNHNHNLLQNHHHNMTNDQNVVKPSKSSTSSSYDWSIRRSERIFLHNTNEPGTSGSREGGEEYSLSNQKHKSGSNPSSISSVRNTKRLQLEQKTNNITDNNYHQPARASKSRTGTSSIVDSDIDVDDSNYDNSQYNFDLDPSNKRVMVAPSSSMPATSSAPTPGTSRDKDSYSSKYKRLRRDRERARRGTSKLCTIKPSDLEELHKCMDTGSTSAGRSMRVIAPIDGWLYSGQLSVDRSLDNNGQTQYVVKLDGDSSGSSYLFTQSTVLNDVIKEVKVKTVSELRKGARICCYWSRTYKCLSTGVVTSRTFEATKSLVSVKYDNGDLSALPLEDLRLLPPDYPKYMSNCDPLLLAKNGDNSMARTSNGTNRIVVNGKPAATTAAAAAATSESRPGGSYSKAIVDEIIRKCDETDLENTTQGSKSAIPSIKTMDQTSNGTHQFQDQNKSDALAVDDSIPPTNETIDFITGDDLMDHQDDDDDDDDDQVGQLNIDENQHERNNNIEREIVAATDNGPQMMACSQAPGDKNGYSVEYQPWRFEGPSKRTKRNGRIYRDNYVAIRRGNEVLKVGDSAELMPRDESILPFVAKIDGIWANTRGEMRVRVRWYYRLVETEGEPYELEDGENALFETDHFDENDVQSIFRTTKILSWTEYNKNHMKHVNEPSDGPKIFYLAGYYDPVRRIKHLRADVRGSQ